MSMENDSFRAAVRNFNDDFESSAQVRQLIASVHRDVFIAAVRNHWGNEGWQLSTLKNYYSRAQTGSSTPLPTSFVGRMMEWFNMIRAARNGTEDLNRRFENFGLPSDSDDSDSDDSDSDDSDNEKFHEDIFREHELIALRSICRGANCWLGFNASGYNTALLANYEAELKSSVVRLLAGWVLGPVAIRLEHRISLNDSYVLLDIALFDSRVANSENALVVFELKHHHALRPLQWNQIGEDMFKLHQVLHQHPEVENAFFGFCFDVPETSREVPPVVRKFLDVVKEGSFIHSSGARIKLGDNVKFPEQLIDEDPRKYCLSAAGIGRCVFFVKILRQ
eukprot:ANDGO_07776.mRNA.1 hypothetical protein